MFKSVVLFSLLVVTHGWFGENSEARKPDTDWNGLLERDEGVFQSNRTGRAFSKTPTGGISVMTVGTSCSTSTPAVVDACKLFGGTTACPTPTATNMVAICTCPATHTAYFETVPAYSVVTCISNTPCAATTAGGYGGDIDCAGKGKICTSVDPTTLTAIDTGAITAPATAGTVAILTKFFSCVDQACTLSDSKDKNPCNNQGDGGAQCFSSSTTSYVCSCSTGYISSGGVCVDIDECSSSTTCGNGSCQNTAGSYFCSSCNTGYQLSDGGKLCKDIDECAGSQICGTNGDTGSSCLNNQGSYTCFCSNGYSLSSSGACAKTTSPALTVIQNIFSGIFTVLFFPILLPISIFYSIANGRSSKEWPAIAGFQSYPSLSRSLDENREKIAFAAETIRKIIKLKIQDEEKDAFEEL